MEQQEFNKKAMTAMSTMMVKRLLAGFNNELVPGELVVAFGAPCGAANRLEHEI